jgi:hypothetical protein
MGSGAKFNKDWFKHSKVNRGDTLEVFNGGKCMITVIWDVTPCSLADRYQRFVGIYCPYLDFGPEDEGSMFL